MPAKARAVISDIAHIFIYEGLHAAQITAEARGRIQLLAATLQERRFMMRSEMRELFAVGFLIQKFGTAS